MNDLSDLHVTQPPAQIRRRVALLIDGDNLSHIHAGALIMASAKHGDLIIKRVYGNMARLPGWDAAPGLKPIHSGTGKNATDLLLAVDAMELMLTKQADLLILATSDGDFSHLAQTLTERGHPVIGIGEAKAPTNFQKSCTRFHALAAPQPAAPQPAAPPKPAAKAKPADPMVAQCKDIIGHQPDGILMTLLGTKMYLAHNVMIAQTPHGTWRKFLTLYPDHFTCDPKGQTARVRLNP